MGKGRGGQQGAGGGGGKKRTGGGGGGGSGNQLSSTTSLGKRRRREVKSAGSGAANDSPGHSSMSSNLKDDDYGSQSSPFARVKPADSKELVKVTILGAAGGIGQPLSLLLMLHSEHIQHLALHDLADSIHGVGLDLSHVDRQVKISTHLGPDGLAEAVRGAKVVVIPAGLAQKPGMSRDDLFASNAEIMINLAKTCATVAPDAMLAIITNPVNSLVPLTCEVYARLCANKSHQHSTPTATSSDQHKPTSPPNSTAKANEHTKQTHVFEDSFRRIFGVTTLDVVRASTLTAKSTLFKDEPNGLFTDPAKIQVPVVGGHAGKTIMPLLSQATPKLDKERLQKDKATTMTLVDSIQQAGIEVLNAKKGRGSATLAMAYAACRFTISLLRAQSGEQNIVECAYVRHASPVYADLDYFAVPLLLAKDGYIKSMGLGKPLAYEQQMLEEGAKELKLSIARGEDFAREHLSAHGH